VVIDFVSKHQFPPLWPSIYDRTDEFNDLTPNGNWLAKYDIPKEDRKRAGLRAVIVDDGYDPIDALAEAKYTIHINNQSSNFRAFPLSP